MKKKIMGITSIMLLAGITVFGRNIVIASNDQAGYSNLIFDTSRIHTVDIELEEDDWVSLKANPLNGNKYHADITIDGEYFEDVSVSAKGSFSLKMAVKNTEVDRYSLKVKFNKYNKKQSYHGLDSLNLNNNITDASEMKDYISYYMFRDMGIEAPLTSYAKITVNGAPYGFFLACEDLKEGYLNRCFDGKGQLYKPEAKELTEINEESAAKLEEMLESGTISDEAEGALPDITKLSDYTTGADLVYTGDALENYQDIFDNAVTDAEEEDMNRVVTALKSISEGQIDSAIDIDEVITYFAVHNFTNNFDSYTGLLNHNYYLYENDGKLQMIPWDYNTAQVMMTDEQSEAIMCGDLYSVDTDIDAPLIRSVESRPMWGWIVNNETYLEEYHAVLDALLSNELESGKVREEIERVNNMIRDEVAEDPSLTYTLVEYDDMVSDLLAFIDQRTLSIRKQLNLN